MNRVSVSPDGNTYYVVSVRRAGDSYYPVSKKVGNVGNVETVYDGPTFATKVEAERHARRMFRTKQKRKDYMPAEDVPMAVQEKFEPDPDLRLSEAEMVDFVKKVTRERYVIFKDVFGFEDRFDIGVEYLAEATDDPSIMVVYDISGEPCKCSLSRFKWVKRTEDSLEIIEKMMNG